MTMSVFRGNEVIDQFEKGREQYNKHKCNKQDIIVLAWSKVLPLMQPGHLSEIVQWPQYGVGKQEQLKRQQECHNTGEYHEARIEIIDPVCCHKRWLVHYKFPAAVFLFFPDGVKGTMVGKHFTGTDT